MALGLMPLPSTAAYLTLRSEVLGLEDVTIMQPTQAVVVSPEVRPTKLTQNRNHAMLAEADRPVPHWGFPRFNGLLQRPESGAGASRAKEMPC
jgi:hypothetical protein